MYFVSLPLSAWRPAWGMSFCSILGTGDARDMDQHACPAVPFTSRVALGKLQYLSGPQFSHWQNQNDDYNTCLRVV